LRGSRRWPEEYLRVQLIWGAKLEIAKLEIFDDKTGEWVDMAKYGSVETGIEAKESGAVVREYYHWIAFATMTAAPSRTLCVGNSAEGAPLQKTSVQDRQATILVETSKQGNLVDWRKRASVVHWLALYIFAPSYL
jgi:hypothetical protein